MARPPIKNKRPIKQGYIIYDFALILKSSPQCFNLQLLSENSGMIGLVDIQMCMSLLYIHII
jgi:hypothetical protein